MTLTKAAPGKKGAASTGPPDEPPEGGWLPLGWVQKRVKRQNGASKGFYDPYWYSPVKQYKFRSKKDVKRFLSCMRMVGGDEVRAYKMFKGGIKTHFTMSNPDEKHLDSKKSPQGLNQNSGSGAQVTERLQTQSGTEKAGAPIAHCTSKINVGWDDDNEEDVGEENVGAVNKKALAVKHAEREKVQEKKAEDAGSKTVTEDADVYVENEKVKQQGKKTDGDIHARDSKPGTFGKYIPLQADDEDEYTSAVEYKAKTPVRAKDDKPNAFKKSTVLKGNDDELKKDMFEQSNDDDDASEESEEEYDDSEEEDIDSEYEEEEEDMEEDVDKSRHKTSKRAPSPTTQLSNYVLNRQGEPTSDDEESKQGNALPQATVEQRPGQSKTTPTSMAAEKVTEQEPCNPSAHGAARKNNPSSPDSASRKRSAVAAVDSTEGPSTNIIQALLSTKTTQSEKNAVLATFDTWKASKATLQTCQNQVSQAEQALNVARKLHAEQNEAHRLASEVMNALVRDNLHPDGRSKRQKRFMPPK